MFKIKNVTHFTVVLLLLVLSACATGNEQVKTSSTLESSDFSDVFTTENIMKPHEGMSSKEILKLFGTPKDVSQAVCGGKDPWTCITWEYGKFPDDKASFTFNGDGKSLVLNSFDIDRRGIELPNSFTSENVMKIKPRMSSKRILETFGPPASVSQAVCGGATGHYWICTTWEYGEFPNGKASFTFSGKHNSLTLNSFDVDKE